MFIETPAFPLIISVNSRGGPEFQTSVAVTRGGFEARNADWAYPRRKYDAALGVKTLADLETLLAFFHVAQGRAHGFRYKDYSDYKSCAIASAPTALDQIIGTGNGSNKDFQLAKVYTVGAFSHTRLIKKPKTGTVKVAVNGVEQVSGWTVNTATGVVTFTVAPTNGHVVRAGYEFDVPCRFDVDYLPIELIDYQLGATQVPIIETRV